MNLDEVEARVIKEGPSVADALALIAEVRRLSYSLAYIATHTSEGPARKAALGALGLR